MYSVSDYIDDLLENDIFIQKCGGKNSIMLNNKLKI